MSSSLRPQDARPGSFGQPDCDAGSDTEPLNDSTSSPTSPSPPCFGASASEASIAAKDPVTEPLDAARAALGRARDAALAKGLRPGMVATKSAIARAKELERQRAPKGAGRDPVLLSQTMAKLLAERGWTEPVSVGGVMGRWREIVGDQIADNCDPETFEDGVLVIRAGSSSWMTQLTLLSGRLIARISQELGDGVVTEIRVRGPVAPSWVRGTFRVEGRGPRDTYG